MFNGSPTTLGTCIHVKHGFAFRGEYFVDEPTHDVLVTPGNFAIGGGFNAEKLKYYQGPVEDDYVLAPGDLVITMTDLSKAGDTLGFPAIVPDSHPLRYLHNQRIGLVEITDAEAIDKQFLYYLLRSREYRNHILATASGSTVRHTSPGRIGDFETVLPDLPEQQAIAEVLGALDEKIEQNRRTSAKLEALAGATFRAWFIDLAPVHARAAGQSTYPGLSPAAFAALPTTFTDSPLGRIPEGWEAKSLKDVVKLTMGQSPSSEFYNESGEGLPFHQGVSDHGFRFPSRRIYCTADGRMAEADDVLLSVRAPVGRINVADTRMVLGRGLAGMRHKQGNQSFLLYLMQHHFAEDDAVGDGTIYKAVNKAFLESMPLVTPHTSAEGAFEQFAAPMDALILSLTRQSERLAALRDYLLPRLLSGAVRVRGKSDLGGGE